MPHSRCISMKTSYYRLLTLLCFIAIGCAVSAESVIRFPRDRASVVAVVVRDLATGKDIVSQNPHKSMLPASTMKCVTTAAAIEARLDTARFHTEVFTRGPIVDGVLAGDLVIRGAGDPTTDSRHFDSGVAFLSEIADSVQQQGIRNILGRVVVDNTLFPDNGPNDRWELADLRYEYGTGLYSLNYLDNARSGRSMRDPEGTFSAALTDTLQLRGIPVEQRKLDGDPEGFPLSPLLTHLSPRGNEIMTSLMHRSDNMFAEGILRMQAPGDDLDTAIKCECQILTDKGIDLDVSNIYDGSGLSRENRLTARVLTDVLASMASTSGKSESYISLFPLAGEEGTVKSLLKDTPLAGKMALKSGSMNGVLCYAGYKLDDNSKPTHVVVIFVNNFKCRSSYVRDSIGKFLCRQFL